MRLTPGSPSTTDSLLDGAHCSLVAALQVHPLIKLDLRVKYISQNGQLVSLSVGKEEFIPIGLCQRSRGYY